jgi:hypothetical protein
LEAVHNAVVVALDTLEPLAAVEVVAHIVAVAAVVELLLQQVAV